MRGLLLLLVAALAGCGSKGPPRAPGASAPPEALAPPPPECIGCILTVPQPGLESADPIIPEAVPRADEPLPAPADAAAPPDAAGEDAEDEGQDADADPAGDTAR